MTWDLGRFSCLEIPCYISLERSMQLLRCKVLRCSCDFMIASQNEAHIYIHIGLQLVVLYRWDSVSIGERRERSVGAACDILSTNHGQ